MVTFHCHYPEININVFKLNFSVRISVTFLLLNMETSPESGYLICSGKNQQQNKAHTLYIVCVISLQVGDMNGVFFFKSLISLHWS